MSPRSSPPSRRAAQVAAQVVAKGIYTPSAAAALLGERTSTIRRWAFGYRRGGQPYPAAIQTEIPALEGVRVLTFPELVELMFIQGLLRSGLSWPKVRDASRVAARLLEGEPHPFATSRWFHDAAALYLRLGMEHDEPLLVEVAGHGQLTMEPVLRPYLQQLEFGSDGRATRWYPRGTASSVVVDPKRAFGMPILDRGGVPTETLAGLHRAGDSPQEIASAFGLDEVDVQEAIAFEASLARAA